MYNNISIVVAIAQNGAIGVRNQLLAHIPGDLPRFKALTTGHVVIMGRKTYESLPNGALPNRRNIVLSRNRNLNFANVQVVPSVDMALESISSDEQVFVIGGGEIYNLFLPLAKRLYITAVAKEFPEADAFFTSIDFSEYTLLSEELMAKTEKNDFEYRYQVWERK